MEHHYATHHNLVFMAVYNSSVQCVRFCDPRLYGRTPLSSSPFPLPLPSSHGGGVSSDVPVRAGAVRALPLLRAQTPHRSSQNPGV
uniref:Uncharacterized protein n=1 Tax=Knipowitschia caucasica TaxID=637954 RepID=A0AAV2M1B8_KNICA